MKRTDIKTARVALNPESMSLAALTPYDFADAHQAIFDEGLPTDPNYWVDKLFMNLPPTSAKLMAARNKLMAPFGLRTSADPSKLPFPKLAENDHEVMIGLDDAHVKFRCSVRVEPLGYRQVLTVETVVRYEQIWGQLYFIPVKRVHKYYVIPAGIRHALKLAYAEQAIFSHQT